MEEEFNLTPEILELLARDDIQLQLSSLASSDVSSSPEFNWEEALSCVDTNFLNSTPPNSDHSSDGSSPQSTEIQECDDDQDNDTHKRKRREIIKKSEAKRRNKFNDQLNSLKSMLFPSSSGKITREHIMAAAIQEINKLRRCNTTTNNNSTPRSPVTPSNQLAVASPNKKPFFSLPLQDPFNRLSMEDSDLNTVFQVLLMNEVRLKLSFNATRTEHSMLAVIHRLDEIAIKLENLQYQLYVSALEQIYFAIVKLVPKDLQRCSARSWDLYQKVKQTTKDPIIFANADIGMLVLLDKHYGALMSGDTKESNETFKTAKDLCNSLGHAQTSGIFSAEKAMFSHIRQEPISFHEAQRIMQAVQHDSLFGGWSKVGLGKVLISRGQYDEGIRQVESGMSEIVVSWGDSADVCYGAVLLDCYLKAGKIEQGLYMANYFLKRSLDLNIDGFMGKAEFLRYKAKFTLLQKEREWMNQQLLQADFTSTLDVADVEMILQTALELSRTRGVVSVELKCALDLSNLWKEYGTAPQRMEGAKVLREIISKFTAPDDLNQDYAAALTLMGALQLS